MDLFNVYPLFDVAPEKAQGCTVWDAEGQAYLDLYGGHAVISIGHSHPHFVQSITKQAEKLAFYSNSVQNPLQPKLAKKLGELSGYPDYSLFLCNSGAEANENALKLASFSNGRKKVIALERAFHGRTSAAVAVTDNPKIQSGVNPTDFVTRLKWNDLAQLEAHLITESYAAVIIEGMQGVAGIYEPSPEFLLAASKLCKETGTVLILDEIQSGYGRTGKFFAHQHAGIRPDLITVAKGMGNGFPIGGVLISPRFEPWFGMLGTTFGGNHLACAAGLAVLEVLEQEKLITQAAEVGHYLMEALSNLEGIKEVRGKGLMLGMELEVPAGPVRKALLFEHQIFTGSAAQKETLRLLPPLSMTQADAERFITALTSVLQKQPTPN
ncbi:MAG: aminotransferase class III-fold pyridoxal phosphate-dependent enzyme [Bacteroidota bacterium]